MKFFRKNQVIFGKIFWVDLGSFEGCRIGKVRPCLIIRRDRNTVTVIPITKDNGRIFENEFSIGKIANLKYSSKLKISHIQTVDVSKLNEEIGELPESLKSAIRRLGALVLFGTSI